MFLIFSTKKLEEEQNNNFPILYIGIKLYKKLNKNIILIIIIYKEGYDKKGDLAWVVCVFRAYQMSNF